MCVCVWCGRDVMCERPGSRAKETEKLKKSDNIKTRTNRTKNKKKKKKKLRRHKYSKFKAEALSFKQILFK